MVIERIEGGHATTPAGFLAAATCAGMYTSGPKAGELDLAVLVSDRDCAVAGVFTRNLVKGWPVVVSQERLADGRLRGVVANSGCSNSLNGEQGERDANEMADLAARHLGLDTRAMSVASTGVTGALMPMDKIRAAIPRLRPVREGGADFALAIMTTDTVAKNAAVSVSDGRHAYSIGACAKGSGMIQPNMGTMLAYVTTDAAVDEGYLRRLLPEIADQTFNMVTVDGDTSCSDTLLVFANGAAGTGLIREGSQEAETFRQALLQVLTEIARKLARDGEGAHHLIEVDVVGAVSKEDARRVALTVANSPLVKTAVAGRDPNWGRILVAAGRSGAEVEEGRASLWMQGQPLFRDGGLVDYDESEMRQLLGAEEVKIRIDLGLGDGSARAWGCDLTTDYVHINADYTT